VSKEIAPLDPVLEIDGARYSGSGTIVRQAVTYAALTRRPVRIRNARVRRRQPGLRLQHMAVIRAIGELAGARVDGLHQGSQDITFMPGPVASERDRYVWDIGSAGSTTLLALAVLPVLMVRARATIVELRGGLFQDFAPSFYHLAHVVVPLLRRMGVRAELEMKRPGYVPRGGGILELSVDPLREPLRPLVVDQPGPPGRVWGIALSSHLDERRVSHRMAEAARLALEEAGHHSDFELVYDTTALQRGAALAVFADLGDGIRLGADCAGAPRRPAERIGAYAANALLADLASGATLDRHASDQIIPFAALAEGESRFRVPRRTEHMDSGAWLAAEFLGARVSVEDRLVTVTGGGVSERVPGLR
jgi:RNA 3'-terminal phosphate cyclase (ATP)